jgi:hypothetical protein
MIVDYPHRTVLGWLTRPQRLWVGLVGCSPGSSGGIPTTPRDGAASSRGQGRWSPSLCRCRDPTAATTAVPRPPLVGVSADCPGPRRLSSPRVGPQRYEPDREDIPGRAPRTAIGPVRQCPLAALNMVGGRSRDVAGGQDSQKRRATGPLPFPGADDREHRNLADSKLRSR